VTHFNTYKEGLDLEVLRPSRPCPFHKDEKEGFAGYLGQGIHILYILFVVFIVLFPLKQMEKGWKITP
jgi:hypothetical protein